MSLPAVVERAAAGELPAWAEATESRRAHMARVSALLAGWADDMGLPPDERTRWAALGYLHDALRDADPAELRRIVATEMDELPGRILHGPAAAARLRAEEGLVDEELVEAVRYHTLGHATLGRLGRALYVADYLEPGRDFQNEWRAELRAQVPSALDHVAIEVAAARIRHVVERHRTLRPETVGFWNALVGAS